MFFLFFKAGIMLFFLIVGFLVSLLFLGHLLWTGSCVTERMQAAREWAVAE